MQASKHQNQASEDRSIEQKEKTAPLTSPKGNQLSDSEEDPDEESLDAILVFLGDGKQRPDG